MKTKKTTLKARRMWANPFDVHHPLAWWQLSCVRLESSNINYTVPVAVIPLDDVDALVRTAEEAYVANYHNSRTDAIRAALAAIGVLPKQRNAHRKGRK